MLSEKKKTEIKQNFEVGPNGEIIVNGVELKPREGISPFLKKNTEIKTDVFPVRTNLDSKLGFAIGPDPDLGFNQDVKENPTVFLEKSKKKNRMRHHKGSSLTASQIDTEKDNIKKQIA